MTALGSLNYLKQALIFSNKLKKPTSFAFAFLSSKSQKNGVIQYEAFDSGKQHYSY
jgi:hypothetical protein